jgi:hypothetical protein
MTPRSSELEEDRTAYVADDLGDTTGELAVWKCLGLVALDQNTAFMDEK